MRSRRFFHLRHYHLADVYRVLSATETRNIFNCRAKKSLKAVRISVRRQLLARVSVAFSRINLLHPSLPYNVLSLSVNLPNPTINQRALVCCLPLLALGRRRSTKIMAFKLNPFVLHPRLTPHLLGRLATCFATRARPESSATVESRLALILRVRSVSTSRPKDADNVKTISYGE